MNDHRGVVDPVPVAQRRPDHERRQQVRRRHHEVEQRILDGIQQRVLQQDVLDRIAGQRQLREYRQRDVVVVTGPRQPQHRVGVGRRVRERGVVGAGNSPHEAVPIGRIEVHRRLLSPSRCRDRVTG